MQRIGALLCANAVLFTASAASASVLWDEAVDGDLSSLVGNPQFNLAVGESMILGTFGFEAEPVQTVVTNDRDQFSFIIPAGAQLVSLTMDITSSAIDGPAGEVSYTSTFSLREFPNEDFVTGFTPMSLALLAGNPEAELIDQGDIGPGTYQFNHSTSVGFGPGLPTADVSGFFDYTLTFTVIPSPAPAGVFALASLACLTRRRSA